MWFCRCIVKVDLKKDILDGISLLKNKVLIVVLSHEVRLAMFVVVHAYCFSVRQAIIAVKRYLCQKVAINRHVIRRRVTGAYCVHASS